MKGENGYYCPLTVNKKFESFLDDLFDLKLEVDRTKKEILNYVTTIENFFTEKLLKIKLDTERKLKKFRT